MYTVPHAHVYIREFISSPDLTPNPSACCALRESREICARICSCICVRVSASASASASAPASAPAPASAFGSASAPVPASASAAAASAAAAAISGRRQPSRGLP
eukprot:scaffold1001_cov334-Prasinococcus_capsulatus_cf.AAC.2